jgi:hypothetical protein
MFQKDDLNDSRHFSLHHFVQNGFGTQAAAEWITAIVLYPEKLTELGFYRLRPCNAGVKKVVALPVLPQRPLEPGVLAQK